MNPLRSFLLTISLALTLAFLRAQPGQPSPTELPGNPSSTEGVWKPLRAALAGQPIFPPVLRRITLTIECGTYEVAVDGEPEIDRGTWTVDQRTEPWRMTIVGTDGPNAGKTIPAIYEFREGNLRVCYDLSGQQYPEAFKSARGSEHYLVTYQRVSKPASTESSPRPNIVLILSDDHSFPNLGCYGDVNARTPNFDRFAATGMRFDRAYTQAPQCVPSRASILTGRSPIAVDMTRFSAPLDREFVTFPELLREAGYVTGAIGRYFHLDGPLRPKGTSARVFEERDLASGDDRFNYLQINGHGRRPIHETAQEFLGTVGDRPYFLWANFHQPHRFWRWVEKEGAGPKPESLKLPPDVPDVPSVRRDLANFYGVLETLDDDFGALIDVLDEHGTPDNTLVLFMGDNGCAMLRGKGTLYDRGTHVPMLARWNGVLHPDSACRHLISGNDVAATALEVAGLPVPATMTGRSFAAILQGRDDAYAPREVVFAQRGVHAYGLPTNSIFFDLSRSVTTRTHRLIYNVLWDRRYAPVDIEDYKAPFWDDLVERHQNGTLGEPFDRLFFSPTRPMFELFDLEADPHELTNLAGQPEVQSIESHLKDQLAEWMIHERDFVPLPTEPLRR